MCGFWLLNEFKDDSLSKVFMLRRINYFALLGNDHKDDNKVCTTIWQIIKYVKEDIVEYSEIRADSESSSIADENALLTHGNSWDVERRLSINPERLLRLRALRSALKSRQSVQDLEVLLDRLFRLVEELHRIMDFDWRVVAACRVYCNEATAVHVSCSPWAHIKKGVVSFFSKSYSKLNCCGRRNEEDDEESLVDAYENAVELTFEEKVARIKYIY